MDVETELAKENDVKDATKTEELKKPAEVESSEKSKDNRKVKLKRSSRSRTPQKKIDEPKILHISLKKVDEEMNVKDLMEGKTENSDKQKDGEEDKNVDDNQKAGLVKETSTNGTADEALSKEATKDSENDIIMEETAHSSENGTMEKNETAKDMQETDTNHTANEVTPEKSQESPKKLSKQELKNSEPDAVEMDPLVIGDEVETELQFLEENSDKESGKGSPLIPRCFTRRSYTRNIPTPKTPKLSEDPDSESNSVEDQAEETVCNLPNDVPIPKTDSNDLSDSMDTTNISTKAKVGDGSIRLDSINDSSIDDQGFDEAYLNRLRERSLSARRPLRTTDDYRTRVLRKAQNKSDLNMSYDFVQKVSAGIKRKNRSITPEDNKKFRGDTSSYKNFFASPLESIKNRFTSDLPSSTPELLGYRDERKNIHFNDNLDVQQIEDTEDDEKKAWCTVM